MVDEDPVERRARKRRQREANKHYAIIAAMITVCMAVALLAWVRTLPLSSPRNINDGDDYNQSVSGRSDDPLPRHFIFHIGIHR